MWSATSLLTLVHIPSVTNRFTGKGGVVTNSFGLRWPRQDEKGVLLHMHAGSVPCDWWSRWEPFWSKFRYKSCVRCHCLLVIQCHGKLKMEAKMCGWVRRNGVCLKVELKRYRLMCRANMSIFQIRYYTFIYGTRACLWASPRCGRWSSSSLFSSRVILSDIFKSPTPNFQDHLQGTHKYT